MRKIATIVFAVGILAGVSAQSQAASHSTKTEKHGRAQQRSLLLSADPTTVGSMPGFCHYLGGPHGTSWVCS
jgi:hypothetical protein